MFLGRLSIGFWIVSVEIWAHLVGRASLRSGADVACEGLARNLCFSSSQRCSTRLEFGLFASFSTLNSSNHDFLALAWCAWVQSGWNRNEPSPNFFKKVGSIVQWLGMLKQAARTLKNSLIPLSLLHRTSQLAQGSQASNILLASAKPRLPNLTAKQRSAIHCSTEHVFTTLQFSVSVFYNSPSNTLS